MSTRTTFGSENFRQPGPTPIRRVRPGLQLAKMNWWKPTVKSRESFGLVVPDVHVLGQSRVSLFYSAFNFLYAKNTMRSNNQPSLKREIWDVP